MTTRTRFTVSFCTAMVLLVGAALAHELVMPETVQADGDGHFAFEATVVVTEPIEFAYSYLDGSDNTTIPELHADGFCTTIMEPGTYVEVFEGDLVDPGQDGSVSYEFALCDGWTGIDATVILAPPVATERVSWSAVKAIHD